MMHEYCVTMFLGTLFRFRSLNDTVVAFEVVEMQFESVVLQVSNVFPINGA